MTNRCNAIFMTAKKALVGNILLPKTVQDGNFLSPGGAPSMERRDHEGYDFRIDADHEIQSLAVASNQKISCRMRL